jgi:hypothetical protein
MRPFLTFSVPNVTSPDLQNEQFATVNWPAHIERLALEQDHARRESARQLLGLDASKMGARAINDVFSTFGPISQGSTPDGALLIQAYRGVYLGAEMVCVGDPLRVVSPFQPPAAGPEPTLVLRVAEILVVTPQPPGPGREPAVRFKGEFYHLVRTPAAHSPPPNAVPDPATLGPAFAEEIRSRDAIESARHANNNNDGGGPWRWVWVLAASDVNMGEPEVLGRFYVTTRLMGIMNPQRHEQWAQGDAIDEPPAYLNARAHSGAGAFAGRRANRAAALGQAISVQFRAPEGMLEE